jgi:hypothetical protein
MGVLESVDWFWDETIKCFMGGPNFRVESTASDSELRTSGLVREESTHLFGTCILGLLSSVTLDYAGGTTSRCYHAPHLI